MSGKDEFLFNTSNLLKTSSGRNIFKSALLRDKSYLQFKFYLDLSKKEYEGFVNRFQIGLYDLISSDGSPLETHDKFIEEVGGTHELKLEVNQINDIKQKLLTSGELSTRINKILNSNFIKMTLPVFYALFDGYREYSGDQTVSSLKNNLIDGHLIAIDLSEPMDRIIDKDEDLEYLDDYRFLNPYILNLAKRNISKTGSAVYKEFLNGFKDALLGQKIDFEMKNKFLDLNYDNLELSYKKYRSVLGTAGKNMSLNNKPLSEIYYIGLSKAAECVGCGNEIQDAISTMGIKSPSWPLYYSSLTKDVRTGFKLTMSKSKSYLNEAYLALNMLDDSYKVKPFLTFLFLSVNHYNEYWYKELFSHRSDLLVHFQKKIDQENDMMH